MKILFICSSLEPGKDGVGDYTRRLGSALIKYGLQVTIVAIYDQHLAMDVWLGDQYEEALPIRVLRLSTTVSWNKRMEKAKKFAVDFDPDRISLQYVPFGFHFKGLPFAFGKRLRQLGLRAGWHIMFHELSVNKDESLKFRIWASLQEYIIHSLMRAVQPASISTNTEIYKRRLESMGYTTHLLPLFSNIGYKQSHGDLAFNHIIPEYILQHREDYIIGTLFGSFDYKSWNLRSLLNKFSYRFSSKRVVIVSIGKLPGGIGYWEQLKYDYPQVLFLRLGEQDAGFISYWLSNYTDFGILTTLPELASKSGSFMAYKEHGVPVVCTERSAVLGQYNVKLDDLLTEIRDTEIFNPAGKREPATELFNVMEAFIQQLELPVMNSIQNTSV